MLGRLTEHFSNVRADRANDHATIRDPCEYPGCGHSDVCGKWNGGDLSGTLPNATRGKIIAE